MENDEKNIINKDEFVNNLMKIFNNYIPKSITFSQIVKYLYDNNKNILDYLSKKNDILDNNNDEMI